MKLVEAALNDPKAVIAFATDAVFSTRPLPLDVPSTKILGEWEFEKAGGISVMQSGVYTIRQMKIDEKTGKPKLKIASRGFSPPKDSANVAESFADAFEREMFETIPGVFRRGGDALDVEDKSYIGLGSAICLAQKLEISRLLENCALHEATERHERRTAHSRLAQIARRAG